MSIEDKDNVILLEGPYPPLDDSVLASSLHVPTDPTNGQVLVADDTKEGGFKWQDIERLELGADAVGDVNIDWGTGRDQVSAGDMPIADAGNVFTGTTVEAALQEIAGPVTVLSVGAAGCKYTTVAAALTAAGTLTPSTTNRILILVKGYYTDAVAHALLDYVSIVGLAQGQVKFTGTWTNATVANQCDIRGVEVNAATEALIRDTAVITSDLKPLVPPTIVTVGAVHCDYTTVAAALAAITDATATKRYVIQVKGYYTDSTAHVLKDYVSIVGTAQGQVKFTGTWGIAATAWSDLDCDDHTGPPFDVTSPSNPFKPEHNGLSITINTAGNWTGGTYVMTYVSANKVTLASDPTNGSHGVTGVGQILNTIPNQCDIRGVEVSAATLALISGNSVITSDLKGLSNPATIVTVGATNCQYTTVAAALAAISDATTTKRYVIQVKGYYTDSTAHALKDYVSIVGSAQGQVKFTGTWTVGTVANQCDIRGVEVSAATEALIRDTAIITSDLKPPTPATILTVGATHCDYTTVAAALTAAAALTPATANRILIQVKGYYTDATAHALLDYVSIAGSGTGQVTFTGAWTVGTVANQCDIRGVTCSHATTQALIVQTPAITSDLKIGDRRLASFDGGGAIIPTTSYVDLYFPYAGYITACAIMSPAAQAASTVLDLWLDTWTNYKGGTVPVVGKSICQGVFPTLTTARGADTTVTTWGAVASTPVIPAGSVIRVNVTTNTDATRIELWLSYMRAVV